MRDVLSSEHCAELLKALAEPDRLRIIQCLRGGPKNVGQIAADLDAEIANVSHHLGVLRRNGILQTEKQGRFVLYRLHPEVFAASARAADHIDFGCCRLELPK